MSDEPITVKISKLLNSVNSKKAVEIILKIEFIISFSEDLRSHFFSPSVLLI